MTQLEITDIGADSDDEGKEVNDEGTGGVKFIAVVTDETWSGQEDSLRQVLAAADTVAAAEIGAADRDQLTRQIDSGEVDLPVSVGTGRVGAGPSSSAVRIDGAIEFVAGNEIPHIFVDSFDTFGESPGVIADRVRAAVDGGAEVHVVAQGFDITEENADAVLGVLDGLDSAGLELQRRVHVRDVQQWVPDSNRAGRPPLGFDKVDGELVPADNIDEVRAVLSMNPGSEGDISKRKAADRLGVSTRTIDRAMKNLNRYGLEDTEE